MRRALVVAIAVALPWALVATAAPVAIATSESIATEVRLSTTPLPGPPTIYVADSFGALPLFKVTGVGGYAGPLTPVSLALVNGMEINPIALATDPAGNLFVADVTSNVVVKVPADGGPQVTVATGLAVPIGVAVDAAGNLFVADNGNGRVVKVPADGGSPVTLPLGFQPYAVAVNAAGDIFVSDSLNNRVVVLPVDGGSPTSVGSGLVEPYGVAVDSAGNVLITDRGGANAYGLPTGRVVKVPADGGPQRQIGYWLPNPTAIAVDAQGRVFVTALGGNFYLGGDYPPAVYTWGVAGGPLGGTVVDSGLSRPLGVAVAPLPPATTTIGAPVTLTATVSTPFGGVPPTGTLTFYEGSSVLGSTPLSGSFPDTATLTLTDLALGDHVISAAYSGDDTYSGSDARAPVTVSVNKVATGTTVSVDPLPSPDVYVIRGSSGFGGYELVKAPGDGGSATTLATGIGVPGGLAVDPAGNAFYLDTSSTSTSTPTLVFRVPADGGPQTTWDGLGYLDGLTVDATGMPLVLDLGTARVWRLPSDGSPASLAYYGADGARNLAVNAAGDLFFTGGVGTTKVPVDGSSRVQVYDSPSAAATPYALAVDPQGNLYVGLVPLNPGGYLDQVVRVPADGGPATTVWSAEDLRLWNFPDIAVDAAGNVYISDWRTGIVRVPAGGGPPTTIVPVDGKIPWLVALGMPRVASTFGDSVTLRATVQTSPPGGVPSGSVTFWQGSTMLGSASLSGSLPNVASLATTALVPGAAPITAVYDGDDTFAASAASAPIYVDVAPATPSAPTITNLPADASIGGSFTAEVDTDSDGDRSVSSSTTDVCTVEGDGLNVDFIGLGQCTLTAFVAASDNFEAATGDPQSFDVAPAPDTTPPSVSDVAVYLRQGGQIGSAAVTLSWSASDDVSPPEALKIKTQVRRWSDGHWTPWRATRYWLNRTSTRPELPFWRTFEYRVKARDAAGNWSAWTLSNTIHPIRRQERHFTLSGDWSRITDADAMKHHLARSSTPGDTATLAFYGNGVTPVMPARPGEGVVEVCVDPGTGSEDCRTVDLGAFRPMGNQRFVAAFTGLAQGDHVLRLTVVSGTVDLDGAVFTR